MAQKHQFLYDKRELQVSSSGQWCSRVTGNKCSMRKKDWRCCSWEKEKIWAKFSVLPRWQWHQKGWFLNKKWKAGALLWRDDVSLINTTVAAISKKIKGFPYRETKAIWWKKNSLVVLVLVVLQPYDKLEEHLSWPTNCEEPMFVCVTETTPIDIAEQAKAAELLSLRASAFQLAYCPLDNQWDLTMSDSPRVPKGNYR